MTAYTRFDSGNDNRNTLPRFAPEALGKNLMFVEVLNRFGRPRGITGAQAALGWMLQKGDGSFPFRARPNCPTWKKISGGQSGGEPGRMEGT